jgi:DNA-binding LytR/AlgR family response regulator
MPLRDLYHVTPLDRFAIRAFAIHAPDHLLKPVNEARFNGSLARARAPP